MMAAVCGRRKSSLTSNPSEAMSLRQPKIRLIVEIDQSRYLGDEDYTGLTEGELTDRESLGNLLDSGYCDVKISLESEEKQS